MVALLIIFGAIFLVACVGLLRANDYPGLIVGELFAGAALIAFIIVLIVWGGDQLLQHIHITFGG